MDPQVARCRTELKPMYWQPRWLVRTFLLEGGYGDVAGSVRPDSGTVVLLSFEERREVLGRLGEGGRPH